VATEGPTSQPRECSKATAIRRSKPLSLQQALEGRLSDHHRRLVSWLLAHIEFVNETMGQITAEVERRLEPHASKPTSQGQPIPARGADGSRPGRDAQKGRPSCAPNTSRSTAATATNTAIGTLPPSILIAAYHVLRDDVDYHDLGGHYFARRRPHMAHPATGRSA
jgi:hypothetical protein